MFKIILALFCVFFVVYCIRSNIKIDQVDNIPKTDAIHQIKYSIRLKHGTLNIQAEHVFIKHKNIILDDVKAVYLPKNITITAQKCEYNTIANQILLSNNIKVTINDAEITTNNATIDIKQQAIASNSNFFYKDKSTTFTGHGFSITQDGDIKFHNVVATRTK